MAPPETMLQVTSLRALYNVVRQAFLAADPDAVKKNPAFLLDAIDHAVLWVFANYPRKTPDDFGQTAGVATVVRLVIISELVSGRFLGAAGTKRLQEAILAAVLDLRIRIEDAWIYDNKDVPDFLPISPKPSSSVIAPPPPPPTEVLPAEKLLKAMSREALKRGVYQVFLDAGWKTIASDPSPLLDAIEYAVQQATKLYPWPPLGVFGQAVITAVRVVIIGEQQDGHFQGITDCASLDLAIEAAVLSIRIELEERWICGDKRPLDVGPLPGTAPSTSTAPAPTQPAARPIAPPLPRRLLYKIFADLDLRDLARASRTCRDWRAAALAPAHECVRVRARRDVAADDGCVQLDAIDTLRGAARVPLAAALVPERLLYAPHLLLVRPTPALLERALAALPRGRSEHRWVRMYDASGTHFAIGTASGRVRECVDVDRSEWNLWWYMEHYDDALWLRVRDVHVEVPHHSWSLKERVGDWFPHAATHARRRKDGRGVLDRPDLRAAEEAVMPPLPLCRLLW